MFANAASDLAICETKNNNNNNKNYMNSLF